MSSGRGFLFTVALAGVVCAMAPDAKAQQSFYVAGYGGSFERMMRESIIPPFEKKHDVKVEYVAGQSTATLAKLQAQRSKQEISVAIVDDGPMYQAVQFGFCDTIADKAVVEDLYPVARLDPKAVAFSIGMTGLVYNEKTFAEKGWPAPTSWSDLANPALKGQLSLLGAASTTGLHGLIMVARANGGGEKAIEPGFTTFKDKIRPNILTFAPSAPKLEELLQNGEIAMTVVAQARAVALKKMGLPVAFAAPKEGAGALMTAICPVAGGPRPELAQAFVQHVLSKEVQEILAGSGYPPANRKAELTPEQRAQLPNGEETFAKLAKIDWPTVNEQRAAWTQRWNREIER
jgi:putative spermidine/putrescine transport system substrate-binding protein